MNNIARSVAATALAGVILVLGSGSAWAHECFVANRSAQGDAAAGSHSAAWDVVSLDTVLTVFIGLPADLAACVETSTDGRAVIAQLFGMSAPRREDDPTADEEPRREIGRASCRERV